MTDYTELYKQLWREIQKQDGRIDGDTLRFVRKLIKKLEAEGWQIGPEADLLLNEHLSAVEGSIRTSINSSLSLAVGAGVMRSEAMAELMENAFRQRWPDGLRLSDRVWNWQDKTRRGLTDALAKGVQQGASVNRLVMDMQRTVERLNAGEKFKIVENYAEDWVTELWESAQTVIHNPKSRQQWQSTVRLVQGYIEQLAQTGSRSAAERVFNQIRKAVAKGNGDLAASAVHWWVYDKQLYHLKRIARTEMSTAMHQATIAGTREDDLIIGYQWRLSSSHPVPDICDYYAGIEMGLGKGVWSKDSVPHHKAHPHCMCLLIPRITPIKTPGSANFVDFIESASPERREKLLPKWVKELNGLGMPLDKLVRSDGMWSMSKKDMLTRMGEDKFIAAQTLGRAMTEKQWPENKLKPRMRMTKDTVAAIKEANTVEGRRFLAELERNNFRVDSREWHYFRYKYLFNDPIEQPADFDVRMDRVILDTDAVVHHPNGQRYVVISQKSGRMAVVDEHGKRISVRHYTNDDLELYNEPLWTINDLLN